jgi:hypothetical protein
MKSKKERDNMIERRVDIKRGGV